MEIFITVYALISVGIIWLTANAIITNREAEIKLWKSKTQLYKAALTKNPNLEENNLKDSRPDAESL